MNPSRSVDFNTLFDQVINGLLCLGLTRFWLPFETLV